MVMARPDVASAKMWEGGAQMRHAWHFAEATGGRAVRELRAGRASGSPHSELSRAIVERLLNMICPESDTRTRAGTRARTRVRA